MPLALLCVVLHARKQHSARAITLSANSAAQNVAYP
jgi:hypothetical protein